jgi:hypothetical protein
LERAVQHGRVVAGEDDVEVLTAAHQLAVVHRQAGDSSAARRVLEEIVAAGQRRHGDADPLMLAVSFELGGVAEELGNRHEARRAYGRVAAHGPGVLGEDHWAVRQALAYLGEDPPTVRLSVPEQGIQSVRRDPRPGPHVAAWGQPTSAEVVAGEAGQRVGPPAEGTPAPRLRRDGAVAAEQPISGGAGWEQRATTDAAWERQVAAPEVATDAVAEGRRAAGREQHRPTSGAAASGQGYGYGVGGQPGAAPGPAVAGYGATAEGAGWRPGVPEQRFGGAAASGAGPEAYPRREGAGRGRSTALFAAVAAVLAAVAAVVALVVVLARPDGDGAPDRDEPTLAGRAPTDVRLTDSGTSVVVSWSDPTDGTVSFLVTFGHPGQQLSVAGKPGPGVERFELQSLNPQIDYCFTVVAVYGPNEFATSAQACTSRGGTLPQPTGSR